MASLNKNGRLQWKCPVTGDRREAKIGEFKDKKLIGITKSRIEQLIEAVQHGKEPDAAVKEWVAEQSAERREKLAQAGLLGKTGGTLPTISVQFDRFIACQSTGVKPQSIRLSMDTKKDAITYFGENHDVRNITVGTAKDFVAWLKSKRSVPLAANTVAKRASIMRQLFRYLLDHEITRRNPFEDKGIQKRVGTRSKKRKIHLSNSLCLRIAAHLKHKDEELCAMFSLCRWGGLRHGEARAMEWNQVDFDSKTITVLSPKTENKGKELRVIPMFPELESCLIDLYTHAREGEPCLFPSYVQKTEQCDTSKLEYATRAVGETPWVCPWQNLRSTRENELLREGFSRHLVHQWIGHTEGVAEEYYLEVLPEDLAQAVAFKTPIDAKKAAIHPAKHHPRKDPKTPSESTRNATQDLFNAPQDILSEDGEIIEIAGDFRHLPPENKNSHLSAGAFREPNGI